MIRIVSSLPDDFSQKVLVLEILNISQIDDLGSYGFTESQCEKLRDNFDTEEDTRLKTVQFSYIFQKFETIICFFPGKNRIDDRSDFFMNQKKSWCFVAGGFDEELIEVALLASYRFQKYCNDAIELDNILVVTYITDELIQQKQNLAQAIYWARDSINNPPNVAHPKAIADEMMAYSWRHFHVECYDRRELEKMGCNLLLAVGAGSDISPYMLVLYPKTPISGETYGLIGKGVTFDAGGLQIKPDTGMFDMKCDMSGAAGMLAVARYLDTLDVLPVNVIIGVGLTENLTGGSAFKPLDIYRAYNGKTVEIHHTDAEGRLVLADVMSYVEERFHVDHLITMATLTGACLYALGYDTAGIMGDDEEVIIGLMNTDSPYEKTWRLPMTEKIKKSLKADIADLKNITKTEKAGSSVGGAFLSYFQGNAKLTHLDIAGPAYRETPFGYMPKGGTGWGVKILSEFLIREGNRF